MPETESSPKSTWNIAIACDTKIGEVFRNNPELSDKYLSINRQALSTIMETLSPEKGGNLLFIASHGDTVNPSDQAAMNSGYAKG